MVAKILENLTTLIRLAVNITLEFTHALRILIHGTEMMILR